MAEGGGDLVSRAFADRYGAELRVGGEASFAGCARLMVTRTCGVHIEAADFPALIAALYEAAGLPAPVILERPGATFEGGVNRAGPIEVGRLGGLVTVGLYGIQPEEIEPAEARRLAALIAICADEVQDGEPDPAEVEELATAIRTGLHPGSGRPGEPDRRAARAAFRWFREREDRP